MKLTVASSLVFGWSSWDDHVSVEYRFACMRPHIVSAAVLVPPEDIATSMALSQMYWADFNTPVDGGAVEIPGPRPRDWRRRARSSGSASSSDILPLCLYLPSFHVGV